MKKKILALLSKRKSVLFDYLSSFAIIIIIIIVLLGTISFKYFYSILQNEMKIYSNATLLQLQNSQDKLLGDLDRSVTSILSNADILKCPEYYMDKNITSLQQINNILSTTMAINSQISSMFIYYTKYNYVLSSNQGYVPHDKFYDKDFLDSILLGNRVDTSKKIRYVNDFLSNTPLQVISFTKSSSFLNNEIPDAILVFNVSLSDVSSDVSYSFNEKFNSSILIKDELTGTFHGFKENKIYPFDEAVQKLKNVDFVDSIYIGNVCGVNSIVSKLNSDRYDWCYYCIMPFNSSSGRFNNSVYIFVIICLLLLIFGVILSFFASKRIYKPLNDILSSLHNCDSETDINELEVLKTGITNIVDENKSMQQTLIQYQEQRSNIYLSQILSQSPLLIPKSIQECYNINVDCDGYFVVYSIMMLDFESFSSTYDKKQQDLFSMYTNENIKQLISSRYGGFIVNISLNELAVVVNSSNFIDNEHLEFAKEILHYLNTSSKNKFCIGVSSMHKTLSALNNAYKESNIALSYRVLYDSSIILYDNINNKKIPDFKYPSLVANEIIENLKIGNNEKLSISLDDFMEYFYTNIPDDISIIKNSYMRLLLDILQNMYKFDFDQGLDETIIQNTISSLSKSNTIIEMNAAIVGAFKVLQELRENSSNMKSGIILENIRNYIYDNPNADLSLDALSDMFFFSTSYLRKLFKNHYNTSIKNFVIDVRMKKARELLANPDNKILDISIQSGYQTTQSFATAFKMHHGISPSDYRANLATNKLT